MKKLFPSVLFVFLMTLSAQAVYVDSLKIIPTNPTSVDTVKVIAFTTLVSSPCPLKTSSVEVIDDTIKVRASHNLGPFWLFCNSIDTLILGVFEPGNYELHYHLMDTTFTVTYDIDTILFTVQQASGLQFIDNQDPEIFIYPVPATTEITIKLPYSNDGYHIEIYSNIGQRIKTTYTKKEAISIDLSDIPGGLYYIVIHDGYFRRWTKKIIKGSP
jgi:hypothetical protein